MSYTASYIVNSSSAQGTTDFQFTFPYIKEEHIEVYLNYSKITQGSGSAQYQVITNVSPKLIRLNTGTASANLRVEVRRNSSLGSPLVDYADGSTLTANDLDTSALQSLYIDQELKDNQSRTVVVDETTGLPELNNQKLTNVADPTAAQDAATKNYVDTKQFTSAQIQDGTLVNADVNASAAIAGTKISPNFGSQNIVTSGTVDGRDVSNDGIKLDSIETGATADQTNAEIRAAVEAASDSNVFTDADHSKLNAIEAGATADQTNAEIRAAVEAASDSNVFTDADHSKLNAIEANATADQTDAEIRAAVEAATDSNVFTDADHSKLNGIETAATADQTASEIKTLLQSDKLTSSEIATGALDGRYYTETEADARFYNLSSGEEIQSGETWSAADNKIATTAAIDARITDLVDDVGGFVPIANETSFPTANPDVNNGAGTLVSIKAFASSHTPSGGSVTIANGAGSGNTVTITGCGSTVLTAGFGGIVETTSTLHTYTFHRLSPKATEVTTVAGNITNINTVASNNTNINTVAGNNSNITTVAGVSGNVTTVAGVSGNVTTVAGISANVTTVAGISSDVTAVAGKATEVGRLGTADAVADLNTLGTTAIVSDLDTCATNISNINSVGGSISNVNTVASNISGVNDFADRYRVASSDPTSNNDEGDLCFNTTSNELRVYNGSAWQGGVTATGNLAGLGANTFTGSQSLGDNLKVQFGAGDDLQIYHDGSNSFIEQTGTGNLVIKDNTGSGGVRIFSNDFQIKNQADSEDIAKFIENGAVELYYDNSKKLETTSTGVTVTGTLATTSGINAGSNISMNDDVKIKCGTGDDLQISHNGLNSTIKNSTGWLVLGDGGSGTVIKGAADENAIACTANGGVEIYYDGSKKFETTSTGILVTELTNSGNATFNGSYVTFTGGSYNAAWDKSNNRLAWNDDAKATFGSSQDLHIYHGSDNISYISAKGQLADPGHLVIKNTDGNLYLQADGDVYVGDEGQNENRAIFKDNGAVELYYDNAIKLYTTSTGAQVSGDFRFSDGEAAKWGNSQDLEIFHNNSWNYIDNKGSVNFVLRVKDTENAIVALPDGAVQLYYDGVQTFETHSSGAIVHGTEGGDANLFFYADEGDDNADKWLIQSESDGFFALKNYASGSWEISLKATGNAATELYYDGVKQVQTTADGVGFVNNCTFSDSKKIQMGDSNDLQIYHEGPHSVIQHTNTSGYLELNTDNFRVMDDDGTLSFIKAFKGASVELYHDGSKKLETTSGGALINNRLQLTGPSIYDKSGTGNSIGIQLSSQGVLPTNGSGTEVNNSKNLGSSSYKWAQVHATTFHGDGSNLTNLPAGGNTISLVANGSLANNKPVKLDSDGKVSAIAQNVGALLPATYEAALNFHSSGGDQRFSVTVYDPDQDTAVIYYIEDGNDGHPKVSTFQTNSEGHISNTNAVRNNTVDSQHETWNNREAFNACYDTTNNKHVFAGWSTTSGKVFVKVGAYSGNGLAFTSGSNSSDTGYLSFLNGSEGSRHPGIIFDSSTGRVVVAYRSDDNSVNKNYRIQVGSYNSSTDKIDFGSVIHVDAAVASDNVTELVNFGAGKCVLFWRADSGGTLYANLIEISSSSNTATVKSTDTIDDSGNHARAAYNVEDDNIIVAYADTGASDHTYIRRITRESDNSGVIASSAVEIEDNADLGAKYDVVYNPYSKHCTFIYLDNNAWNEKYIRVKDINNTSGTPTFHSGGSIMANTHDYFGRGDASTVKGQMYIGADNSTLNAGRIYSINTASITSNLTDANDVLGFPDAAYTNGQTATIKTYGNTVDTLSGLTIGSLYYVQSDGTLATSWDNVGLSSLGSNTPLAGIALSATKLLIRDPLAKT